jgi:hypothetical protein
MFHPRLEGSSNNAHFGVCLMLDPVLDFVNVMPETTVLTSTASGPAVLS